MVDEEARKDGMVGGKKEKKERRKEGRKDKQINCFLRK
jgi:hypothetical protein